MADEVMPLARQGLAMTLTCQIARGAAPDPAAAETHVALERASIQKARGICLCGRRWPAEQLACAARPRRALGQRWAAG